MLFNTWLYAIFLTTVFVVYWALPFPRLRPYILIASGLVFYANYFPPHVILILGLTVFIYFLGEGMRRTVGVNRTVLLVFGLTATVGCLVYYKYASFLLESLRAVAGISISLDTSASATIRAPLAISFFTFEFVHYLVEVHRGNLQSNLRDFLLFIMFFPTLISGPIKRYQNFSRYLDFSRRLNWAEVGDGLERILFGLAKKIIVADSIARLTAPVWQSPLEYRTGILWLAGYGYALQIYADFSGYSDIAIGSAKLLGFKVEENFNWPYLRSNIRDFWRSWHMSLTSWITDYIYIPLGGNRGGRSRAIANTLLAMGICGLWHGPAFHFLVWGLYHGTALAIHRLYSEARDRRQTGEIVRFATARRVVATTFTFHVVVIGWMLFIMDTGVAFCVIARMLNPFS